MLQKTSRVQLLMLCCLFAQSCFWRHSNTVFVSVGFIPLTFTIVPNLPTTCRFTVTQVCSVTLTDHARFCSPLSFRRETTVKIIITAGGLLPPYVTKSCSLASFTLAGRVRRKHNRTLINPCQQWQYIYYTGKRGKI